MKRPSVEVVFVRGGGELKYFVQVVQKLLYFLMCVGMVEISGNPEAWKDLEKRISDFIGGRKLWRVDLRKNQAVKKLDRELTSLSRRSRCKRGSRHILLSKLSFFALDQMLLKKFRRGLLIRFPDNQDLYYLGLLTLVSPVKKPKPASLLPIPVVNHDYFSVIEDHLRRCQECRDRFDKKLNQWEAELA